MFVDCVVTPVDYVHDYPEDDQSEVNVSRNEIAIVTSG